MRVSAAILLLSMLSACLAAPAAGELMTTPHSESSAAEQTLRHYFDYLSSGRFEQGAALYGGALDEMQLNNPEVEPDDLAALFESACRLQLRCLPVEDVVGSEEVSPGEFVFQVKFKGPDGETFVLGPCCGASEEIMPPMSVFEVRVRRTEAGDFEVLDLPVYVP